jgi:hypothetical protein
LLLATSVLAAALTFGSDSLDAARLATLWACFSTSVAVLVGFAADASFFAAPGLLLVGPAFAGLVCFSLEAFRTGLTSVLGSRLALLSLRSLRADDTPLELLVLLPLVGGAGRSFDLNSFSLSNIELEFFCWGLAW